MTRQALLAAAAALTMIATPALADRGHASEAATSEAAATSAQASTEATPKAERKTCRTYRYSETRVKSEKLCLTREEWRKFDEQQ
jgi:hypothetical protein